MISYWYRPSHGWDGDGDDGLFSLNNTVGNSLLVLIKNRKPDGANSLRCAFWMGAASGAVEWLPTTPWRAGEWHHLAASWGPRGVELFVDGERVASDPFTGVMGGGHAFSLLNFSGLSGGNASVLQNAILDGLKVWDVQKSPDWVRREYLGVSQ